MSNMNTIVIADSLEIVREGIATKLETCTESEVIGLAEDGFTALKLCRSLSPDILVMDLELTRPSGMETLEKVRRSCPDTKILVLSSDFSVSNAFYSLSKGAVSFIPKQAKGSDFVSAIHAAANGFTYLPTDFVNEFVQSRRNMSRTGNLFGLSPREMEVLTACSIGKSTKEIAQSLEISVRTVETHRNSIYRKTSCNGLEQLRQIASTICPEEQKELAAVA